MAQSGYGLLAPIPLQSLDARPLVSVLVANYNYARFIGAAIESVLHQSYSEVEIVVCDDGSTDNSVEVVGCCQRDNRVRLVRKENGGSGSALNAAFAVARGSVVCILDADDVFLPGKIGATVAAFQAHPECGMVTHYVRSIDAKGRTLENRIPPALEAGWVAPATLQRGGHCWVPPASGLSIHRSVADYIFPIPLELRRMADGYIAKASVLCTNVCALQATFALYRLHGANVTGTIKMSIAMLKRNAMDEHLLIETVKGFLGRHYGPQAAVSLSTEDLPGYWGHFLAATILQDPQLLRLYESCTVAKALARMPRRRRLLYQGVLALPIRRLRFRALEFWRGQSMFKRFLRLLLHMMPV